MSMPSLVFTDRLYLRIGCFQGEKHPQSARHVNVNSITNSVTN